MQKLSILVFMLLAPVFFVSAQDPWLKQKLDSVLKKNFQPKEPGIAVLVAKKGKVVYREAFGSANLELDVPLKADMVFKIGSITKQFTATGILQLVEQGKISLQDSIQKFVPDFPSKGHTVTIEHMLTHTSGLKDFMTIDHPDIYIERHDVAPKTIIDHFKNAPLEFEPGTKYNYSNSNYALLGFIIEKASGKTYYQYMKENVLDRAGLKNTSYARESEIVPGRVTGYTRDKGFYENTYYQTLSLGFGAGDLLSTLDDLFAWNKALMENKLVKNELQQKAFTPYRLKDSSLTTYGYGLLLDSVYGRRAIWHAGQVSGFISFELYFPAEDVYVALFTNVKSGEDQTAFSNNRFRLFFEIPFYAFNNKVEGELTVSKAKLDNYAGKYDLNGRTVLVKRKDDMLYLEFGEAFALHPISETRFIAPVVRTPTYIDFIKDNTGKVVGMSVWQGRVYAWKKIE
jgi:CubicO group peptidase (beta-lactamase class C family)